MIDLLIPVLNRPHRAAPLVENILRATVNEHRIWFICSRDDDEQIAAADETGAQVITVNFEAGVGDYAKKINNGYKMIKFLEEGEAWSPHPERFVAPMQNIAPGEFLFLGADDLCFCQAWDTHALATAEVTGAGVIGTDDLGNATVIRGDHSTHSLVRRSYIAEQGGTWDDGPGVIYHEGYDHQYVDSELVEVAKQRGQWAFSHASKVEHMHKFWGKSEMDDTYKKALRSSTEDMRLFRQRKAEFS